MEELKKILLVEDDPNDIELTLGALEGCGLANEVVVVNDGADALDYIYRRGAFASRKAADPAVVLLDIKLPKVNGIEVLATLKSGPDTKGIPVVMLTSSREEIDLVRSYELGANAYVVKPVDFRQFMAAVEQIGAFWAILNERPHKGVSRQ
jgi:CheY-like chemotaxis protein